MKQLDALGRAVKRLLDIFLAGILLLVLSPLLFLIVVAVYIKLGRPILFRQSRPGLRGTPFRMYKFRTMSDLRDPNGRLLPDAERLSTFGHFLRSFSLDELPELWNVVRGKMSLVGPRPLLMKYLARYNPEQFRRHDVKPGITGWAQVNGRNALSWEDKFRLDVWYVDHWSLWLDAKILFLTIVHVLKRKGIAADGHVTMPEFLGTERQD